MTRIKLILIVVILAGIACTGYASATPSGGFQEINEELFDDWSICRTRSFGEDGFYQITDTGFRPVIVYESLGNDAAFAYNLGRKFTEKYPDRFQRAEMIFEFVKNSVDYASDIDHFRSDEFAQNADELAMAIDKNTSSYGDCEDSATLLAVMYKGAGYRTAIAVAPGHTAALVYLPDYDKAPAVFKIAGEPGWMWAEATGKNNPLGWVSKEFIGARIATYEIGEEEISQPEPAATPSVAVGQGNRGGFGLPFPFFSIIAIMWLMSMLRRRRPR